MEKCYQVGKKSYYLIHKKYDDDLFKTNVYELLECAKNNVEKKSEQELKQDLKKINFCTFRGEHNSNMINLLEKNNFYYVDNFLIVQTSRLDFKYINNKISIKIELVRGEPSEKQKDEILKIEKNVFDYSTFQNDFRINPEISSKRNCLRVKSYFKDKNHIIFLAKDPKNEDKIIGFLQFILSDIDLECVNGAVISNSQGFLYGPVLYSYAFNFIFKNFPQVNTIFGGCSLTNTRVLRLFQKLNFKIIHKEVHFRKIDIENDAVSKNYEYQ